MQESLLSYPLRLCKNFVYNAFIKKTWSLKKSGEKVVTGGNQAADVLLLKNYFSNAFVTALLGISGLFDSSGAPLNQANLRAHLPQSEGSQTAPNYYAGNPFGYRQGSTGSFTPASTEVKIRGVKSTSSTPFQISYQGNIYTVFPKYQFLQPGAQYTNTQQPVIQGVIPNATNNFTFELRESCRQIDDHKQHSINAIQCRLRSPIF
ncbi:MAG: hypothetical protein KGZ39_03750, partial [Simkania sp.]|nr:hypothetical protein [Simkania sp.]